MPWNPEKEAEEKPLQKSPTTKSRLWLIFLKHKGKRDSLSSKKLNGYILREKQMSMGSTPSNKMAWRHEHFAWSWSLGIKWMKAIGGCHKPMREQGTCHGKHKDQGPYEAWLRSP